MGKKRMISAIVALGLVLSISTTALATPEGLGSLLNQKNKQQQQMISDKNNLSKLQNQTQGLETQIEIMDSQIESLMRTLDDNKKQVQSTQNQIDSTKKDIAKAEIDIKAEQDLFDERMRVMYISGTDGYISILLDSKNFGDFFLRVEAIKKIAEYDTNVVNDLKSKREIINNKKTLLDNKNIALLALKADNEKKLSKLSDEKKSENLIVVQVQNQQKQINDRVKSSTLKIASLDREIVVSRGMLSASSGSNGSYVPNESAVPYAGNNALVSYAYKFIGTQYVWGGTTPSGFDCSGFMQYVFAHFGIGISRTSEDQVSNGSYVPRDQLQPGDLVFFGSASAPHHVGMYVGNGQFIHAPHTGDVIKVSDLSIMSDYATARRIK